MKMRLKCKLRACTAIACTFILLLSSFPVYADDIESLEEKTEELEGKLDAIYDELDKISDEILNTEMEIEFTAAEIERTKAALIEAEREEARQYADMKSRIKYMYEAGNTSLLQLLFSAENMTDFLNKAEFITTISEYDRDMLVALQETRQRIAEEKLTLEEQQEALKELEVQLAAKQSSLQAKADETQIDLDAYKKRLADARAAEAARLAAEAAAAAGAAGEDGSGGSGGGSNQPITGGTATEPDPEEPPLEVSNTELDVFAAILDCEAYQNYNCQLAVATVIMNRVNDPRFPNTVSGVVYAPGQFSPVSSGKLARVLAKGPSDVAYRVAQDALNGVRLAEVINCYYFLYAPSTNRTGVNVGGNLFFERW